MTAELMIPVELNPACWNADGMAEILARIEDAAHAEVSDADVSTVAGRKRIAGTAYKVARSKTHIDEAGKALVAGWKAQSKAVDIERKKARDVLDALKVEVRRPLTEWEEAEEAKKAAEALAAEIAQAHESAMAENALLDERRKLEAERAEIARQEEARRAAEAEARAEAERLERERRIAEEATARAKSEAEARINAEKEARIRAQAEAERQKAEAEARAHAAAEEATRKERERTEAEARRKAEADALARAEAEARAADRNHRAVINRAALEAFVSNGIPEETGKKIIRLIAQGTITGIRMQY